MAAQSETATNRTAPEKGSFAIYKTCQSTPVIANIFFIKHSDGVKNQPRAKNRSAKELAPDTYSNTYYITQEPHSLCGSCFMTPFH